MIDGPAKDFILPRLERALDRAGNTHTFEEIVPLLQDGRAQWWAKGCGVVITEILRFPQFNVLNYWLVAGSMDDCLALQPEIDRWAVAQGCRRAIATGRQGWLRVLPKYGWRPYAIAFRKDLRQ